MKSITSANDTSESCFPNVHPIPYPNGIAPKQLERHKCRLNPLVGTEGMWKYNHPHSNCYGGQPERCRESCPKNKVPPGFRGLHLWNSSAQKASIQKNVLMPSRSKHYRVAWYPLPTIPTTTAPTISISHESHSEKWFPFLFCKARFKRKWKYPHYLSQKKILYIKKEVGKYEKK